MDNKTFSRMSLLVLLITISVLSLTQSSHAKIIPNAYIVQVADTADVHQVAGAVARFTGGNIGHVYTKALWGFAIRVPAGIKKADILTQPGVVLIEPDLEVTVCAQTLPTGVDRIDADLNNTAKIDGIDERVDVAIAIIDTGIDIDHPDLNVVGGRHFYTVTDGPPWDRNRQDDNYDDDNGHGSHVAGTAAAIDNEIGVVGVAPGARLWAIKVLDSSGSGYLSDIIAGVDWVTQEANQIEVANISLIAEGTSDAFRTAIQNSVAAGVVHIVAAGNNSSDVYGSDGIFNTSDDMIPAAYPEVATISAMADSDGQPGGAGSSTSYGSDDSFASSSNFSETVVVDNPVISPGAAIDLLMPGVNIYSTNMGGGYTTKSGTSMASPHAAGLAALYIAINGRAADAAGVYVIRQALIDGGVAQDSTQGLAQLNDPDTNWENIGWAGTEKTYIISASAGANGSIDPAGDIVVNYGDNLAFTATPDTGYEVDTWFVDSNSVQSGGTGYTLTNIQANHTVNVTFKQLWYAISGYVTEPDANIPIEGVFIDANNGGGSETTDANGYYEVWVDYNWSGTVEPNKTGYTFEPNSIEYDNVTTDQNDNYIATLDTFFIDGYVFDSDMVTPLDGVLVSPDSNGGSFTNKYYGGGWDTTDANGYYEVLVDYNFSGKVVPSKYAYVFEPNSITYADVTEDKVEDQNYVGTLLTYTITGYIENFCEVPIADVLVDANNGGGSDITDANGFYEVWVDYNWSGTVTPSKVHYTFDPNYIGYTDVLEDWVGENYVADNIYDLDCNGSIGLGDLAVMCENWLETGPDVPGDFYKDDDDIVNFLDFAEFALIWQER